MFAVRWQPKRTSRGRNPGAGIPPRPVFFQGPIGQVSQCPAPPLDDSPRFAHLRAPFLKRYEEFAAPQAIAALNAALREVDPRRAASALTIAAQVEASGNRVVLLAMPSEEVVGGQSARNALLARPDLALIDLSIDQGFVPYPDPDYFFDQGHLAAKGAAVVSHEVGLQLCRLLQAGR